VTIEAYIKDIASENDESDLKTKKIIGSFIDYIIDRTTHDGELLIYQLGKFVRHADFIEFKPSKAFIENLQND
jgi:nucleoid DNA-binding protein